MADRMRHIFTSESVTEGHPDKMADQISDAVLDAVMTEDPTGRVACEVLVTTGICVVSGEITTSTYIDVQKLVRAVIRGVDTAPRTPEWVPAGSPEMLNWLAGILPPAGENFGGMGDTRCKHSGSLGRKPLTLLVGEPLPPSVICKPNRCYDQYEANAKQPGKARFSRRGLTLQLSPDHCPILLI